MRRLVRNFGIKGLAFFITLLLCLNAETDRMVEVDCRIPLQYVNLPDSLVLMGSPPTAAQVKVIFNRKFWQLRPGNLLASVDLTDARSGTERFALSPDDVVLPHDRKARVLEVLRPRRVALTFEREERKRVKVFPVSIGVPADGYVIFGEPKVEPGRVVLIGARSAVAQLEVVHSDPVDLTGSTGDVRQTQRVDLSAFDRVECEPAEVEVFFDVEPIEDRVLLGRPIRTSPRHGIVIAPDSLDVVVRGPAAMLAEIPEKRIRLSLNVTPLPEGEHLFLSEVIEGNRIRYFAAEDDLVDTLTLPDLEGSVQNLPDQVVLVDFSPKVFRIERGRP